MKFQITSHIVFLFFLPFNFNAYNAFDEGIAESNKNGYTITVKDVNKGSVNLNMGFYDNNFSFAKVNNWYQNHFKSDRIYFAGGFSCGSVRDRWFVFLFKNQQL